MQAMAAHNAGGLVIVQVERLVERGTIPKRLVHIPGIMVDKVGMGGWEVGWVLFG
jgi:propionate CoA-transferase